jgi:DNA-binding MarR family transcriptional regulator
MDQNLLEQHVRAVKDLARDFGVAEVDTTGMELARLVRMVSNLYQAIGDEHLQDQDSEVSGPRWGLLLRLRREELHGNLDGCSPTHLSRCQSVSKNTISALVRGLEEQGLIERALDPEDRRGFRIRLSDAGRRLVANTAPLHLRYMNELVASLAPDEQAQLAALLQKLYRALASHARKPNDASSLADANALAGANALARPLGHSPAG